MTLFLRTGTRRSRAVAVAATTWLAAAILLTTSPATAATRADLAGPLRDLAALDAAGQLAPAAPAAVLAGVQNGRVQVEVLFKTPGTVDLGALQRSRGIIQRHRDRRVQVSLPVASLRDVALIPSVAQVRVPPKPVVFQGIPPTVSEAVQLTNALSVQVTGITGLGASVAVIDMGFLGYTTAELPPTLTARSFRSDGIIDGIIDHGTMVAETIADMAPAVDMYLLCVETQMDVEAALDWCLANDIDILNASIGFLQGPFDGTFATDRVVDRVRQGGVLPVISAGNAAHSHWAGDFVDGDGDGFAEFAVADEGISIQVVAAGAPVQAYLSWFQTASPTGTRADVTDRDYDLVLTDPMGTIIAQSAVTQNGDDPPSETLFAVAPTAGAYELKVFAVSSNIPAGPTDRLKIFTYPLDVEPTLQVPEGSLSALGTAQGALTVGATRAVAQVNDPAWIDYPVDTLEPFSSQGPTVDGRQKPEMSGPDGTLTSLGRFFGTSSAAPHVAGGAALLRSEDTTRTANELQNVLLRLAADQNQLVPITLTDSTVATIDQAGVGRLSLRAGLDTKPPVIAITFPLNGSTITTAQPTVVGVVTDSETGVDPSSIIMTLDSVQVAWDSFSPGSGVVTYTPVAPLTRAAHTVTLVASDLAGNEGDTAVSNFRVSLPTLGAGLHMISLPYRNLANADPASIFGVGLNDFLLVRWLPTDAAFNKYRVYPDPLAGFEPPDAMGANPTVVSPPAGLGYFVNLPHEVILNVSGESLSDVSSYVIQLPSGTSEPRGWHMIGNPFQDAVDWSTVQFVTNGVRQDLDDAIASGITEGVIFEYVPGGAGQTGYYDFVEPQSAVLKAMKGYWLHVLRSTEVIIYPATVGSAATQQAARDSEPRTDDWKAQLIAEAPGMLDTANYLGVAPDASSGHDVAADVPEPPPLGDSIRLYFPHPEWGTASGDYAQDMRARGAETQTWKFEVSCPAANTPVSISWPCLNATVPGDVALRLRDLDAGRSVYMRTASSYAYDSGAGGARHFELVASRTVAGALRITSLSAAPTRGGGAVVTYQLTAPASITAEVRNIAGRPVRHLVAGQDTAAGRQTLVWNGRNDNGTPVPAGTYLVDLTARADDGQAVKRLCPVNAAR